MTEQTMAEIAQNHLLLAKQVLGWHLDNLRLHAGLLEPIPDDEPHKPGDSRYHLRRASKIRQEKEPRNTRMINCGRRGGICPTYAHFHEVREVHNEITDRYWNQEARA